VKSPIDATSKPTSANVKSFATLKMKAKLEKSAGAGLNAEQSVGNISAFKTESGRADASSS